MPLLELIRIAFEVGAIVTDDNEATVEDVVRLREDNSDVEKEGADCVAVRIRLCRVKGAVRLVTCKAGGAALLLFVVLCDDSLRYVVCCEGVCEFNELFGNGASIICLELFDCVKLELI